MGGSLAIHKFCSFASAGDIVYRLFITISAFNNDGES
jgi:hypothetical protein